MSDTDTINEPIENELVEGEAARRQYFTDKAFIEHFGNRLVRYTSTLQIRDRVIQKDYHLASENGVKGPHDV